MAFAMRSAATAPQFPRARSPSPLFRPPERQQVLLGSWKVSPGDFYFRGQCTPVARASRRHEDHEVHELLLARSHEATETEKGHKPRRTRGAEIEWRSTRRRKAAVFVVFV